MMSLAIVFQGAVHMGDGFIEPFDHTVSGVAGGLGQHLQFFLVLDRNIKVHVHGVANCLRKGFSALFGAAGQALFLFGVKMNQCSCHEPPISHLYHSTYRLWRFAVAYCSAAVKASARTASCSAKTVRRSSTTAPFSTRAITEVFAPRRKRCSICAAERRTLRMRTSLVGNDCAGVDPPPASDSPSTISMSSPLMESVEVRSRMKVRQRSSISSRVARIMAMAGTSSSAPRW